MRTESCIFFEEDESCPDQAAVKMEPEGGEKQAESVNPTFDLNAAIEEFESLGARSRNYGYVGSQGSLCSCDKMNEHYEVANHYMYRFMIADIRVTVPSVSLLVVYPNHEAPASLPDRLLNVSSSLYNALLLSVPNPLTATYGTIITPTSRDRIVVNIPAVLLRVLKGKDYCVKPGAAAPRGAAAREADALPLEEAIGQRFLCIGEVVLPLRLAL